MYYIEKIKAIEYESALDRYTYQPWNKIHRSRIWGIDKYDLFAEFPILEAIDYNRLIFEAQHPIPQEDRWPEHPYCCYPFGCVMCAAAGCTCHWEWKEHFNKINPRWR